MAKNKKKEKKNSKHTSGKSKSSAMKVKAKAKTKGGLKSPAATVRPTTALTAAPASSPQPVLRLTHDQIAKRAFELWKAKGEPAGMDEVIWHEAETELTANLRR